MTLEVLITECRYYMDLGKLWYAVKPISPKGSMFYVYATLSTNLARTQDIIGELNSQISEKLKLNPEDRIYMKTTEPQEFYEYLTEDDKKLQINPKPEYIDCEHGNGD